MPKLPCAICATDRRRTVQRAEDPPSPICHRTLRRQVLEYIRYTNRIPITQEFRPTEDEQALYDMVSDYLRRPSLQAPPSSQRSLMTLTLRKLLASSTFAIAGALDSLARKLERQLKDDQEERDHVKEELAEDYEELDEGAEEWSDDEQPPEPLSTDDITAINAEIADLRGFRDLAVSITENAKGQALLSALKVGFAKAVELGGPQKAIIFTESRRTQDYLVRLLSAGGYGDQLALFNGTNADPQSRAILLGRTAAYVGDDDHRPLALRRLPVPGRDHQPCRMAVRPLPARPPHGRGDQANNLTVPSAPTHSGKAAPLK